MIDTGEKAQAPSTHLSHWDCAAQQTIPLTPKTRLAARSSPIPAQIDQIAILFMAPSLEISGPPDTIRGIETESHIDGHVDIAGGLSRLEVTTELRRQRPPKRNNSVVNAASPAPERFVLPLFPPSELLRTVSSAKLRCLR